MHRRKLLESLFKVLMISSLAAVILSLIMIIAVIVYRGAPSLTLSMLTQVPRGGYYLGKEGGIFNAIVGSLYLGLGSTLLAFVLSLPIALALQREYSGPTITRFIRLGLDVLWGIPSIVYGAFGFVIMLYFGVRVSLLGGIIALTLLVLPIMTRPMEEVISMVPRELKEVSFALGATRLETTIRVVLKQALPGIFTAVLLAFGRGIGDAASVLFTAGYTDRLPTSLSDPVASLPLAIFFQLATPFVEVQERAYAAAVVLLVIVLLVSLISRWLARGLSKHIVR
ncbi:MAG TPA: phosphate ABC transporter permease PstA [Syntrophobacteraceae bacterium]|nr:phosphate ABC transporter permease PstA [Syntrophobacteraceae bacterium]